MSLAADPSTGELLTPTFEWPAGVHPAADLFPMMDPLSFSKLVEDIRANGLIEPIWLDEDGLLLDGRNRLAACQSADVTPESRTYSGDDPVSFVISLNVNRRHLSTGQLAMVSNDSIPLYEEQARNRQLAGLKHSSASTDANEESGRSAEIAAKATGVGRASVNRATRVQREAPELAEKVRAGEMTLNAAHDQVKHDVTPIFKGPMQKLAEATAANADPNPRSPEAIAARVEQVRAMSAKGHSVPQIAAAVGVAEDRVRKYAKDYGITLAVTYKTNSHDANRIVNEMTVTLEGLVFAAGLIDYPTLDRSELDHWVSSLTSSLKSLNTVKNKLTKELTQ